MCYNFYQEGMEKSYKFKYQSSKKALEAITKFNYYFQDLIPEIFANQFQKTKHSQEFFKCATGNNNLLYFWGRNFFEDQPFVNQQSIMHAAKLTQLAKMNEFDTILKINQRSYQKISKIGGSLFTYPWNVSQVTEFLIKSQQNKVNRKTKFQFYIIHHCQNQLVEQNIRQLKWVNFVEKYVFQPEGISYDVLLVANQEKSYFGLVNNQYILQSFIKSEMKFETFQGHLLQYKDGIKQKIKQEEDPAFSEQHKLLNQIPSEFIKMFYSLKKQFGPEKQQVICRFMIARQFNLDQCRKSIKQYIEWHDQFIKKYTWQDFQEFQKMNIFYYLGQDYKGRPVILNKAKNVLVDEMDGAKYCDFYMYYLEIYMPKKMRGNVYQLNIIADVEDVGQKNFKLAITKQNIEQGKKYCVQRQYKFFAVNASPFAHFCWRFIKPLLPKKTLQKVYVGGNKKEQIVEGLLKDMSIEVIPTYLGGKNPIL